MYDILSSGLVLKKEIKSEPELDVPSVDYSIDSEYGPVEATHNDVKLAVGNAIYKVYQLVNHEGSKSEPVRILVLPEPFRIFECSICHYKTVDQRDLTVHTNVQHEKTKENELVSQFCKFCGELFLSAEHKKEHVDKHTKERKKEVQKKHRDKNKQKIFCTLCFDFEGIVRDYSKHMKLAHNVDRPYKCKYCICGYKTPKGLQGHMAAHDNQLHSCPFCPRKSISRIAIERHYKRIHLRKRNFKCDQCDYATMDGRSLQKHMRKHTGERPYKCNHCGFRTAASMTLQMHIYQHTGERPQKCSLCSYSTIQRGPFKAHFRKHLSKDPFGCWLCTFRTSKSKRLFLHECNFHNMQVICFYCHETFEKRKLKKHIFDEHTTALFCIKMEEDPLA